MDCQIKITDNKAVWKIQAALALIFLLNPFLGVLSTLFFVFVSKEKSMAFYLVIILTLFMWCLQSTRSFHLGEPSDWAGNYYYNFHNGSKCEHIGQSNNEIRIRKEISVKQIIAYLLL